jgi:hypothetical protein
MKANWHPSTMIEKICLKIEDTVASASSGLGPHTNPSILRIIYKNVKRSDRFDIAFQEWRNMVAAKIIGIISKHHFKAAEKGIWYLDTTATVGYHNNANAGIPASTAATTSAANIVTINASTQEALAAT